MSEAQAVASLIGGCPGYRITHEDDMVRECSEGRSCPDLHGPHYGDKQCSDALRDVPMSVRRALFSHRCSGCR